MLFLTLSIISQFFGDTYALPTMVIIWGQPTGSSTPESTSYSTWNDCLTACMAADSCVLAATKSNVESDGCYIYLYGKVTNVQSASKGTTKVAFKMNLNDSTCPSADLNPPMFGKSILYTSILNASSLTSANLKVQRDNMYTITEPTPGNWVLTYGGCFGSEISFTRFGLNYCLHKFDTLIADASTAESNCESNMGFLHTTLNVTEFYIMQDYLGNSTIDYWVDATTNCGGTLCSKGVYYSNRWNKSTIGNPSPDHCYFVGDCDPCLQYDILGYVDTSCTNAPAGYICMFPL